MRLSCQVKCGRETSSEPILAREEETWLEIGIDRGLNVYIFITYLTNAHFFASHSSRLSSTEQVLWNEINFHSFSEFMKIKFKKTEKAMLPFKLPRFYNEHRTSNLARFWLRVFLLSVSQKVKFTKIMKTHALVQIRFCCDL